MSQSKMIFEKKHIKKDEKPIYNESIYNYTYKEHGKHISKPNR